MTILAGTLQTDPRSGGIKRSSGVNVMPSIAEGMKMLVSARQIGQRSLLV